MAQQIINNGESGLTVRSKINDNFTELYTGQDAVTVNTFADLPAPATVTGQRYWVLSTTGVYLVNRRQAGAYYSNGTAWTWLGDNPTTAAQIGNVPAGAIASTNVQAAINELDSDLTGVTSGLPVSIRSQVESMLVQGANVSLTYSGTGASRQVTIAATGGGGGGSPAFYHFVLPWAATGDYVFQSLVAANLPTVAGATGRIEWTPFIPSRSITVDELVIEVTTLAASSQARLGIYSSTSSGLPDALLSGSGTLLDCSTIGTKQSAVSPPVLMAAGTTYWLAVHYSAGQTVRALNPTTTMPLAIAATSGSTPENARRAVVTFASGLPATAPTTTLVNSSIARIGMRLT